MDENHLNGSMTTGCSNPLHSLCNHGGTADPQSIPKSDPIDDAIDLLEKEIEKDSEDALTPRQAAFVLEYIKDFNGTQSAIRAGYSNNIDSACSQGQRLLGNARIKAAINEQLRARARRNLITADKILADMDRLAQRCMQAEKVMIFDKEEKKWVPLKNSYVDEDGKTIEEYVYQFDSAGANKALENLARNQKLLTDKTEIGNLDGTNFKFPEIKEVFVESPEALTNLVDDDKNKEP